MITYGGEKVSLDAGAPSIYTIGVALGRIPRFCGHTREFYPVLGHVLVVAKLLPVEIAIHGLMHDAQECLFADVPTPMKSRVARNREARVLERIYAAVGVPFPDDEIMEQVHEADHTVLIAEAHALGHPGANDQWGPDYDKTAARLTREQMKSARLYLEAENAGRVFTTWFRRYAVLSGATHYNVTATAA